MSKDIVVVVGTQLVKSKTFPFEGLQLFGVFDFVFQRLPIYYAGNWYYRYRTLYTGCVCVLLWAAVVLFLTHRLLKRIEGYMKEIQYAAGKLVDDSDDVIDLSPELGEISSQLNQLKQTSIRNARAAREAEQRKNDLIMYLAHDLKTPLSSVIGYLTLLHEEPDVDEATRTRYLTTTLRKAERLDTLINEFFEITRFNLSHLTLELTTVDLTRMLEQTCSEFEPSFAEKHLRYTLELPPQMPCECDPDKLARVFDNLLRNANFYSFPDTEIRVSGEETRGLITLRFENSGPTIPREKLDRIFEQFFRLDSSRSSASGGAGLGLAIAKEIVRLHGGSICAASEDNRIVFTVTLPRSQTPPPPSP